VTRSARQAALGALIALVGCSVYDASLLVGGAGGVSGRGGSGSNVGGSNPEGGSGGSTGGSAAKGGSGALGGHTSSGGSAGSGVGGSKGGTGGDGSSATGGTGASAGSTGGNGSGGDAQGGTGNIDSSGGMGDEGGVANPGEGGTNASGTGGTDPGAGGSAGVGGSAGAAAGTGGSAGAPPVTATGCAKLNASIAASTDKTHYLITLGSADVDFTSAVVSVHLYVQGTDGGLFLYLQQATYEFYGTPLEPFSDFSGWTTLTWDFSAITSTGTLDKTKVRRLGLEIGGTGGSTFTNPTVVYVDAITVTTPALSFPFDATASVNTTPVTLHTGDTALWQNSASADTTATGSTLEWVASCP
jgi:hypothetical protein